MNRGSSLTLYLAAQSAHFAAGGMMGVVFPWLIAHELNASDARVGLAQFFATLPMMFLILVGGATADGRDLRGYVARLQLFAAVVPIALATIVALHQLSFFSATACMIAMGVLASFIMPARDALLSYVTPPETGLARSAAMTIAATFGGQLLGSAAGASASTIGAAPLLCMQAALLVAAGVLSARVHIENPQAFRSRAPAKFARLLHEMRDGLVAVWRHERLRTIILYLAIGGPLFNGMFLVGFPLIVRDVYHGDSAMLSLLITAMLLGLTISAFAMSRFRPVERPGRMMMLLSLNNVVVFTAWHFAPPFPVFVALSLLWGLQAGVGMAMSRGMVQAAAPHEYRARVLSMLQFSQIAGGPPGALLYGLVSQAVGILNTLLIAPAAVIVLWLSFRAFTRLWDFRREDTPAEASSPVTVS